MATIDSFRAVPIPQLPPEPRHHDLLIHLPDIVAVGVFGLTLVAPAIIIKSYPDSLQYTRDVQSGLIYLKIALVSQLPNLLPLCLTIYARQTRKKGP